MEDLERLGEQGAQQRADVRRRQHPLVEGKVVGPPSLAVDGGARHPEPRLGHFHTYGGEGERTRILVDCGDVL